MPALPPLPLSRLSPSAKVVLQVKKGGRAVKAKTLRSVPMNTTETYSFRVTLNKGSYRWSVSTTDLAGTAQTNVDTASFKVK
jgi:hypothetical protein